MIHRLSTSLFHNSRRIQRNGNRNDLKGPSFVRKGKLEMNYSLDWKRFASSNVPQKPQFKNGLKVHPDDDDPSDKDNVIEFQTPYQPPPKITMDEYFPHLAFDKQVLKERAEKQKQIEDSMTPHDEEHDEEHGDHHVENHAHDSTKHHDVASHDHHHSDPHHHHDHHSHGNYEHQPHGDLDHPDLNAQKKPEYSTMMEPFLIAIAMAFALSTIPFDRLDEFNDTWNPLSLFKRTYCEPLPITDTRGLPLHIVPVAPPLYRTEYFRHKIVRAELDGPFGKKLEEALQQVQDIRARDKKVASDAKQARNSISSHNH